VRGSREGSRKIRGKREGRKGVENGVCLVLGDKCVWSVRSGGSVGGSREGGG